MSRLVVRSTPHIDLSPVKAAAHSRQIMLLRSACRPGDPLLRSPSLPYDLEEVGSPPWRSVLRSWPLTLDAMHILSGAMGPCPPATVTALSPTPLLHAVDLPKQASLSSPAVTLRYFPPIHPRHQYIGLVGLVFSLLQLRRGRVRSARSRASLLKRSQAVSTTIPRVSQ